MSNNTIIKGRNKQAIAPREEYLECNVSSLGNLQTDATSICMGSEDGTASGTQHQLKVDSTGALHIVSEMYDNVLIKGIESGTTTQKDIKTNTNGDLRVAIIDNSDTTKATSTLQSAGNTILTDGTAITKVMGSEDATTSGTQRQLHVDGTGNLQTNVVNTINVAPANSTNSGITDDPANSVAVGLRGRTDIALASTETFLKCDATGVLEVSSSGGGSGGVQYAVGTTGLTSGTGTLLIGSAGGTATEAEMSVLGALNIKVTEATNLGTSANLASNATIASDGVSSVVDISNFNNANILYEDTNVSNYDAISVEASCNSSDYFIIETIYPSANPSNTKRVSYRSLNVAGLTDLRIRNISSSTSVNNVYATVVGSP